MGVSARAPPLPPPVVDDKLLALDEYDEINNNNKQDLIKLLQCIRAIVHKHDKVKGGMMAIVKQDIRLYIGCYQKQNQTLTVLQAVTV